ESERGMGFCLLLIESDRFERRLLGSSVIFLRRREGVPGEGSVCVGQAGVGERVLGIELNCLLEVLDAFVDVVLVSLVPQVTAAQVELIRFRALGGSLRQPLPQVRSKPWPEPV